MPIRVVQMIGASASSNGDATAWIPTNLHQTPFNLSFGVYVSGTGQPTVRVEHTFHDVMRSTDGVDVFIHEDVTATQMTSATNTVDGNYAYAPAAIRLAVVSASGNSTVHFRVIQAGV